MKELDFDELDRAVNSLMGDIPADKRSSKPDDSVRTLTIPEHQSGSGATSSMVSSTDSAATSTTEPSAATTTSSSSSDAPTSPPTSTPPSSTTSKHESTASLATRRSGRFMDVVHPSSDMKNPENTPRQTPSRQGSTLQPLASRLADAVRPATPVAVAAASTPASHVEPETNNQSSSSQQSASDSDWPDPIASFDVEPATSAAEVPAKPIVAAAVEPATEPAAATPVVDEPLAELPTESPVSASDDEAGDDELFTVDDEVSNDEQQPLESPFLSNMNIQKRPLGGSASSEKSDVTDEPSRVSAAVTSDDATADDPDNQLPADPTTIIDTPLPDEFGGDLVAIESDDTGAAAASHAHTSNDNASSAQSSDNATGDSNVTVEPTTKSEISAAAAGATSIQPQYNESVSTGEQSNGAIYDTKGYHEPLAHPVKKKSGWMWIVWVLIILVVGAGGGAALYLLKII